VHVDSNLFSHCDNPFLKAETLTRLVANSHPQTTCQKVTFDVVGDPKGPQASNKRVKQSISLYLEQTPRTTRGVFLNP
jgi:hypothetical protein